MTATEVLSASLEDYLEAIFHIVSEKQAARAKDIARRLEVNNSSVTGALRVLSEKNLINYAPYDVITLTPDGQRVAREIVRKHEAVRDFFVNVLHIEKAEAEDVACKIEHLVSRAILDRLIRFNHFVDVCPRSGNDWIKEFWNNCEHHCQQGKPYERCEECMASCLENFRKKRLQGKASRSELNKMYVGQKGKIQQLRGSEGFKQRMKGMGLAPGSVVEVEHTDTADSTIGVKVRGYHHLLNAEEASQITVELYM